MRYFDNINSSIPMMGGGVNTSDILMAYCRIGGAL